MTRGSRMRVASGPAEAIELINSWLPRARSDLRLRLGSDAAVLREESEPDPVLRALGLVALDAAMILGSGERHRLRICAGDCSARLFDRSPGARRTWCSMRTCGNVAKARRHRDRARRRARDGCLHSPLKIRIGRESTVISESKAPDDLSRSEKDMTDASMLGICLIEETSR
jgi:CGNR zinc finger